MKRIGLALAVLISSSGVFADDALYTKNYSTCVDKSGGVTLAMLDCIAAELKTQDARLNGAYKKLGTQLTPARKKQLQAAQRLWIQYRDANCAFYSDPDGGGTAAAVSASDCVLQTTATRAKELENILQ